MTSENDDETVSSLDSSRRSSPFPAAATSKGILVHKKRSANPNRVSFSMNSPSRRTSCTSMTSSIIPSSSLQSAIRSSANSKKKYHADPNRSRKQSDDEHLPYYTRTGRRLTGFGIKSYLNDFYDELENRGDSFEDDDFKYCVEPEIHWRRHCCGTYAAFGLIIMIMGAVTMMIGHLMPIKDPVVGRSTNMEVIDRWAVTYNENLASCRYVGSVVLAIGVVFTVVRFWISVIRGNSDDEDDERSAAEKKLGDRRLSLVNHRYNQQQQVAPSVRISISGSVENVQPDPRTINMQISDNS